MTVRTFDGLGFDPAPGEPATLAARARDTAAAAGTLQAAAGNAARLDGGGWVGDAAAAFRERAAGLPRDLDRAAAAHGTLARTLAAYAAELTGRQARAADLDRRAAELRRQLAALADRPSTGSAPGAGVGSVAAAAAAGSALAAVLADAHRLHGEHRAAARQAAARIRAATDPPYERPGLVGRLREAADRWVTRHADTLHSVSTGLRGASAVLGAVSLVPGFQFLAPLAIAAGAAAVVLDATVRLATGRGSWATLALDAALTVLPAGPVARTLRSLPRVGGALKAVNRAVPAGVRGPLFRAARNLPEGITAAQLRAAATRIRAGAGELGADVVVQGSRAGHCARVGSDIDVGLRVAPEHYDELIHRYFGDAAGVARQNAVERGRIFWHRAGLRELHHALQGDLGRKVDLAVIKRGGRFDGEPWLPVR